MEVDDVSVVTHLGGVQANVCAIEMEAVEIAREPEPGIAPDDDEILIQRRHLGRQHANALIFAVRICDAQSQLARRDTASVAS